MRADFSSVCCPEHHPAYGNLQKAVEAPVVARIFGHVDMWRTGISGIEIYLRHKWYTLIYTSSPVLIIFLEWLFRGRKVGRREFIGIAIAMFGVLIIIFRGSADVLMSLNFNNGDLLFVLSAVSWSIYSVLLKTPEFDAVPTISLFAVIAFMGALTLAPFTIIEIVSYDAFPTSLSSWANIAGIVLFASLIAFTAFQHGVKVAGAPVAGIFMYLLPVYGVGMAMMVLGEQFELYHLAGIITVSGGVIIATIPLAFLKKLPGYQSSLSRKRRASGIFPTTKMTWFAYRRSGTICRSQSAIHPWLFQPCPNDV